MYVPLGALYQNAGLHFMIFLRVVCIQEDQIVAMKTKGAKRHSHCIVDQIRGN